MKKINIGTEVEPKLVTIGNYWDQEIEQATTLFVEYKDVFAWSYKDLKGIPFELGEHKIELLENAKLVKQRPYRMNPKYKEQVKNELDKLLVIGYIFEVENSEWFSPIVVVPKKNGKLRVCVGYRALNKATKRDPFSYPIHRGCIRKDSWA